MKLREIRSENFGVFRQRRFDLNGSGLVLVHGPNEAGKSTLLQLLRELLFGFPHSSPFSFDGAGPMAAEADAVLRDGRALSFRRRKGRNNTVEGELAGESKPIDEQRLSQLLGHASSPLYSHVFAFSLTELAEGVEGLKTAGLTDALFGGGLGGLTNLQRVRRNLQTAHEELFKPAASKLPINKLLSGMKDAHKRLKEAVIKPKEFLERQEAFAKIEGELSAKREAVRQKVTERDHCERLIRAWQPWHQRQVAAAELSLLQVPDQLQSGDAAAFQELLNRQTELEREQTDRQSQLTQIEHELATLASDPALLERGAEIKTLEQELGKIEGFLRDLPVRQTEHKEHLAKIEAGLRSVNPDWTIAQLNQLRLSLDDRTRVRELVKQHAELQARQTSNAEDVENLRTRIARDQARLEGMQDGADVEAIALALAGHAEYSSQRSQSRNTATTEARLRSEMEQQQERLMATVPDCGADLEKLQPPLATTMDQFREEFAACQRELAHSRERLAQQADAHQKFQTDLLELEATGRVPDSSQLLALRQRRDAGWELIREHYIQGTPRTEAIAAWLADKSGDIAAVYSQAVAEVDQLSDERLKVADLVAKKDNLLRQLDNAAEAVAKTRQEVAALETRHAEIDARWRKAWAACGIAPLSPAEMLEWQRGLENYQQKGRERQQASTMQRECEAACGAFEKALRDTLGDQETNFDRLVHSARAKLNDSKQIGGRRQELEQQIAENESALTDAHAQAALLVKEQEAWREAWQALLARLKLPQDWEVKAIEELLVALEQAFHDERLANEIKPRIDDMTRERDMFDKASRGLSDAVAEDLSAMPMIERVRQLGQRWTAARDAANQREALTKDKQRVAIELGERQSRLEELARRRAAMLAKVKAANDVEFIELTKQAVRRDELLEEIRKEERALGVAREQADEKAFEAELQTLDLTARQRARDDLNLEIQALSEQIDALQVASGKLQHEMEQLHEEGESLVLQQSIESQRGQLREHVGRWSSLVLAEKVLQNALEKFQREHQPAVLAEARRLFEQMTRGEHVDIRRAIGDTIWVVDRQGTERRPDQLSRGTREQLYLAFRLAYVQHYCRDSEPLPVVMDDVLVNFDQQRAANTLAALNDISRDLQIIFLTCHAPTVALVQSHCPSCHTLELGTATVEASSV